MTASSRFITYIFFAGLMQAKIILVHGDCWYDNKKHEENSEVLTGEPCLNCTCSRGALLCYLRVCPKLPNPPPPGCILLHRFKTCCPELICSDFHDGGNSVEARADPDANLDTPSDENNLYENACISNGSIYGSGSAMHSSSMCEYCYCLSGKQVCVKPKCLLFIEGCQPIYETSSCCPVRYNCTRTLTTLQLAATQKPSTTTAGYQKKSHLGSGCLVENAYHPEGSKVVGIGHSVCDNCYCLRGLLRCEPLSCAPPLLGCTPVVKSGECCAASYNCNGTLEVEPEPNYGLFPIISKEYSKLRKEVNGRPADGVATGAPFDVQVEDVSKATPKLGLQRSPETFGTTRQFVSASFQPSSTEKPLGDAAEDGKFFLISSSKHRSSTEKNLASSAPAKSEDSASFGSLNIFDLVDSLLNGKSYRKVDTISAEDLKNSLTEEGVSASTEPLTTRATTDFTDFSTNEPDTTETMSTSEESGDLVTVTAILNSTDCNNGLEIHFKNDQPVDPVEINHLAEGRTDFVSTTTDSQQTEDYVYFSSPENLPTEEVDYGHPNGRNTVKMGGSKLPPDIEAILNITNQKIGEDFDYDYKEPTLPPSLPNLKIIPFLATDALDVIKDSPKDPTDQIEDKVYNIELEHSSNLFRPPVRTEGGFVPKTPSADPFYNSIFAKPPDQHVQDISAKVTNCISRGQEIAHGMEVPAELPCVTCSCFFGNIACQKVICPPPEPGCRRTEEPAVLCCPNYDCNHQEVPLLEPPKLPQEIVTVAEGIEQSNPLDVIRTEPAPNLERLIGDRHSLQTPNSSTPATFAELSSARPTPTAEDKQPESSFDELLKFIFSGTPDVIEKPISHNPSLDKNKPTVVQIKSVSADDEKPELQLIRPINGNTLDGSAAVDANKTEAVCPKCDAAGEGKPMESSSKKNTKGDEKGNLVGVGLLKLAGCNIYGRMYRVGRIISELSGPCLECKCTEVGVQCIELRCTKNNGKIQN